MEADKTVIYFNPDCSKCREAMCILEEHEAQPEIVEYLQTPPTAAELAELVKLLGIRPEALVRKGESLFTEQFEGKEFSDAEWLTILSENPVLIERPIVIRNGKALIGRPPSTVLELF